MSGSNSVTRTCLALDTKITLQRVELSELEDRKIVARFDREEYSRQRAILIGLRQQRADLVSEYNARSRMVNRVLFKGNDTPERIAQEGE